MNGGRPTTRTGVEKTLSTDKARETFCTRGGRSTLVYNVSLVRKAFTHYLHSQCQNVCGIISAHLSPLVDVSAIHQEHPHCTEQPSLTGLNNGKAPQLQGHGDTSGIEIAALDRDIHNYTCTGSLIDRYTIVAVRQLALDRVSK